jgi:ABC-type sugar transport system ATPase subunit
VKTVGYENQTVEISVLGLGKTAACEIANADFQVCSKLLILDEPTASQRNSSENSWICFEFKKHGMTSILISHKTGNQKSCRCFTILRDGATIAP